MAASKLRTERISFILERTESGRRGGLARLPRRRRASAGMHERPGPTENNVELKNVVRKRLVTLFEGTGLKRSIAFKRGWSAGRVFGGCVRRASSRLPR